MNTVDVRELPPRREITCEMTKDSPHTHLCRPCASKSRTSANSRRFERICAAIVSKSRGGACRTATRRFAHTASHPLFESGPSRAWRGPGDRKNQLNRSERQNTLCDHECALAISYRWYRFTWHPSGWRGVSVTNQQRKDSTTRKRVVFLLRTKIIERAGKMIISMNCMRRGREIDEVREQVRTSLQSAFHRR